MGPTLQICRAALPILGLRGGFFTSLCLGFILFPYSLLANPRADLEPVLTLKTPQRTLRWTRSELLQEPVGASRSKTRGLVSNSQSTSQDEDQNSKRSAHPAPKNESKNLKTLVVDQDPAYPGNKMVYQAVPLYSLFKGLNYSKKDVLQYTCRDGFSAAISLDRILNSSPDQSIAYLAIEPKKKWPKLPGKAGNETAGPFYVVWSHPEISKINREEWPFQVVGFEIKRPLEESYPAIVPASSVPPNSPIRRGFKVFTQVCFNCHTLNHQGESHLGPDLNQPMNPTQYYKTGILKKFIRNPKSVRDWPNSIMPPFPESVVSDAEIDDLILYLEHMSSSDS